MYRSSIAMLTLAITVVSCAGSGEAEPTPTRTPTVPPTTASPYTIAPTTTTTTTALATTTTFPPTTHPERDSGCSDSPSEDALCPQEQAANLVPPDGLAASDRTLVATATISGDISPKSVVASGNGLFFAQNMMYRHTITVYDSNYELVKTIPDAVEPSRFGHTEFEGEYLGSPVEAAFTSDGGQAYVSNYKMYGGGLSTAASDGCNAGNWPDSFVYGVDTSTLEIDQVIRVGSVPKYLAVTPNDEYLLVANWCGFDVSVIHLSSGEEVVRLPVGRHPRGIAVSPDSRTVYVAVMGSRDIGSFDLEDYSVTYIENVGANPRHLVMSPDGRHLYVSLNGEGRLAKLDLESGEVMARVATGAAPRSMAISDDGTALYVVNYKPNTISKVRTSDMVETEEHRVHQSPIGITYDVASRELWVANYSGSIQVFTDTAP